MENFRKHSVINLVTNRARRNYLVSKPNYHKIKTFLQNLLAVKTKRAHILMNKPVFRSIITGNK